MNSPKRIAFISEHASPVALLGGEDAGGQNVYVDEVSRHLAAHSGYQVDLFTRCDDFSAPDIVDWAPGVRVINLKIGPPRFLLKDELWPLMPQFCDAVVEFARQSGAGYDLIHSNFWMSGWAATNLKQRLGSGDRPLPVVHIFHAMGLTKRRHQGDADTSPDERIDVERQVIREVERLIAQCPSERDELINDYEAAEEKVAVIPSGVDVQRFRPLPQAEARRLVNRSLPPEARLDPDTFTIVYVGRMVRRKGVRNVVRGLARLLHECANGSLPPIRFLIVGGESADPDPDTTPEIGALQALAQEQGVAEYLTFTGHRQSKELCHYYSAGDVAVTTPWYEPFGLTPLEAMACGRPVIGSAVGGIKFTVLDRETGFLVPPKDPHALADSLYRIISNDELRHKMGRNARRRVEEQFTWPTVARRTAALYEELLDNQETTDGRRRTAVNSQQPISNLQSPINRSPIRAPHHGTD
jgi:glycosyltransferase involved in cell wall biosynthesis